MDAVGISGREHRLLHDHVDLLLIEGARSHLRPTMITSGDFECISGTIGNHPRQPCLFQDLFLATACKNWHKQSSAPHLFNQRPRDGSNAGVCESVGKAAQPLIPSPAFGVYGSQGLEVGLGFLIKGLATALALSPERAGCLLQA